MFNDKHDCHDILQDMVAFDAILTITLRLKWAILFALRANCQSGNVAILRSLQILFNHPPYLHVQHVFS